MNEFISKKLGEVLAFSQAGVEIFEKGNEALISVFQDETSVAVDSFTKQAGEIEIIAQELGGWETVKTKSEKAKAKLLAMAETYIGEEWDNPAELLEWLGFFEGAAIVHWKLVEGVAKETRNQELLNLAEGGVSLHTRLFELSKEAIRKYAQTRAKK